MDIETNTHSLLRVGDELGSIMRIVQEFSSPTPAAARYADQRRCTPRVQAFTTERSQAHFLATGEACHD